VASRAPGSPPRKEGSREKQRTRHKVEERRREYEPSAHRRIAGDGTLGFARFGQVIGDDAVVEDGASRAEVLVGHRGDHHNQDGRGVQEHQYYPAGDSPPCHGEQPDPHQHVARIEQKLGTQQSQRVPHPGARLLGGQTDDLKGEIVGDDRNKEAQEIYPVPPVEEAHRAVSNSHTAVPRRLTAAMPSG
jgi:hypothetical protein